MRDRPLGAELMSKGKKSNQHSAEESKTTRDELRTSLGMGPTIVCHSSFARSMRSPNF